MRGSLEGVWNFKLLHERWPGRQVLIAPAWIDGIDWGDQTVRVGRTRQEIKNAPKYDPTRSVDRDYEDRLYRHYGVPAYWAGVP